MSTPPDTPLEPLREAAIIREQTKRDSREELAIWEDGIERLAQGMDVMRGIAFREPSHDRERVLFGLLAQAINTQFSGHYLATAGYYVDALALVRSCVERWLAFWYVWNSPQEAHRFLRNTPEGTPDWNVMLQEIERIRGERDETVRSWRKMLNKLSHVDRANLPHIWGPMEQQTEQLRLGPHYDRTLMAYCVSEFGSVIPPLMQAVAKLTEFYGRRPRHPMSSMEAYLDRLIAWQRQKISDAST